MAAPVYIYAHTYTHTCMHTHTHTHTHTCMHIDEMGLDEMGLDEMEMALNLSSDTLKLESQLKYCYMGKRGRGGGDLEKNTGVTSGKYAQV